MSERDADGRTVRWSSEVVALQQVAPQVSDTCQFVARLDTFGHNADLHLTTETDDRLHDPLFCRGLTDVTDERHVELDEVGLEVRECREASVAGAEIVHGNSIACVPESTG